MSDRPQHSWFRKFIIRDLEEHQFLTMWWSNRESAGAVLEYVLDKHASRVLNKKHLPKELMEDVRGDVRPGVLELLARLPLIDVVELARHIERATNTIAERYGRALRQRHDSLEDLHDPLVFAVGSSPYEIAATQEVAGAIVRIFADALIHLRKCGHPSEYERTHRQSPRACRSPGSARYWERMLLKRSNVGEDSESRLARTQRDALRRALIHVCECCDDDRSSDHEIRVALYARLTGGKKGNHVYLTVLDALLEYLEAQGGAV